VRSSRGGQATCHAPGQLIVYTLLNLHRIGLGVRTLVACLEDAVISLLTERNVPAHRRDSLPGVYVRDNKIASIGLRINRGHSFHGLALNVAPDLRLFKKFCVCGNPSLTMTSLHECGVFDSVERTAQRLLPHLKRALYHDRAFT